MAGEPRRARHAAAHELGDLGTEDEPIAIHVRLAGKRVDDGLGEWVVDIGHGLAGAAGGEHQPGIVRQQIERPVGRLAAERIAEAARHALLGGGTRRRRQHGGRKT